MNILVLNCGSSSIKYKLLDMKTKSITARGSVEKIGLTGSFLKLFLPNEDEVILEGEILEHRAGIEYILGAITSKKYGCIRSLSEIDAVGHRIVHGGEKFNSSVLINDEVIKKITDCIDLAPLHNPPNLSGIYAIKELMPSIPQVGVFDTAFHQTMPDFAYMYGLPYSLYKKYAIRRYGFHGTSHRYVSKRSCEILNMPYKKQRIITCHIGNGASITAIKNGMSVDTSMGMTPVEGLLMGTRCGDIDAGILTYIMEKENVGSSSISTIINKCSGVLGTSGISSDMREISDAIKKKNKRAILALSIYTYKIKKYIGAYAAALGGVDILVFTGGVGENQSEIRQTACDELEFMGIKIDKTANYTKGKEIIISTIDSKTNVIVIPTDEELMIALDTLSLVTKLKLKL
ncbi:MAG: acetate kinase [Bacteroidales bacterium OttesenSCG-928-I14]|jgi:acetate kinase|nr:acetate kinase [Bacteroidales bacterium OttesenSCG-928-I14]